MDRRPDEFARIAVRWRDEGAQLIGGCRGVGPEQIGAARAALAGKPRGAPRPGQGGPTSSAAPTRRRPSRGSMRPGAPCTRWPFPDLVTQGDVFAPSQAVCGEEVLVGYLLEIVHRR